MLLNSSDPQHATVGFVQLGTRFLRPTKSRLYLQTRGKNLQVVRRAVAHFPDNEVFFLQCRREIGLYGFASERHPTWAVSHCLHTVDHWETPSLSRYLKSQACATMDGRQLENCTELLTRSTIASHLNVIGAPENALQML